MKFKDRVLKIVAKIPKGKTFNYKEVANLAGSPKAYRSVGNILNRNYNNDNGIKIPCHRVIRSDGKIGGFADDRRTKRKLLLSEKTID